MIVQKGPIGHLTQLSACRPERCYAQGRQTQVYGVCIPQRPDMTRKPSQTVATHPQLGSIPGWGEEPQENLQDLFL